MRSISGLSRFTFAPVAGLSLELTACAPQPPPIFDATIAGKTKNRQPRDLMWTVAGTRVNRANELFHEAIRKLGQEGS